MMKVVIGRSAVTFARGARFVRYNGDHSLASPALSEQFSRQIRFDHSAADRADGYGAGDTAISTGQKRRAWVRSRLRQS